MSLINASMIAMKAIDGWTKSAEITGTSAELSIYGTSTGTVGMNIYLTDLLVGVTTGDWEVIATGTAFLLRLSGTSGQPPCFSHSFTTYPRTHGTETLYILVNSPSLGTVSLSACGFTAP